MSNMSFRVGSDANGVAEMRGTHRRLRVALVGVVLFAIASTWKAASWASTSTPGASECTTLTGTAKTASRVNLSDTAQPANVVFALNAAGCAVPRVDAEATNGPATQAAVVGTLKSPSARCVLSTSDERPWGKLTVKWQNAAGAALLNSAGRAITDQLFVRLDPDGVERYDLHGFDSNGPNGGGDVSAEIGFRHLAECGTGPTKWSVISDGNSFPSGSGGQQKAEPEAVGSDGEADSFVIERFSTAETGSPTTSSTSTTTTTVPALHATVAQICGSSTDGIAVDTLSGEVAVLGDSSATTYGPVSVPFDTAAIEGTRPGCVDTDWTPPDPALVAYCQLHPADLFCVAAIDAFAIRTHVAAAGYEAKLAAFGSCALTTLAPESFTACVDAS